jgi:hypothetical protein
LNVVSLIVSTLALTQVSRDGWWRSVHFIGRAAEAPMLTARVGQIGSRQPSGPNAGRSSWFVWGPRDTIFKWPDYALAVAIRKQGQAEMPTTHDEILSAALKLPENERLSIATQLLNTLPSEAADKFLDDEKLLEELERRAKDGSEPVPLSDIWKRD